jgi:uncharacterized protein (UPF0335 family)
MSSAKTVAGDQLRSIIERVERLLEEKQEIADQVKEVFSEAKANGFDAKAIRRIIKIRKQDPSERETEEAVLELYLHALGML